MQFLFGPTWKPNINSLYRTNKPEAKYPRQFATRITYRCTNKHAHLNVKQSLPAFVNQAYYCSIFARSKFPRNLHAPEIYTPPCPFPRDLRGRSSGRLGSLCDRAESALISATTAIRGNNGARARARARNSAIIHARILQTRMKGAQSRRLPPTPPGSGCRRTYVPASVRSCRAWKRGGAGRQKAAARSESWRFFRGPARAGRAAAGREYEFM
jgi:hypothetical protein